MYVYEAFSQSPPHTRQHKAQHCQSVSLHDFAIKRFTISKKSIILFEKSCKNVWIPFRSFSILSNLVPATTKLIFVWAFCVNFSGFNSCLGFGKLESNRVCCSKKHDLHTVSFNALMRPKTGKLGTDYYIISIWRFPKWLFLENVKLDRDDCIIYHLTRNTQKRFFLAFKTHRQPFCIFFRSLKTSFFSDQNFDKSNRPFFLLILKKTIIFARNQSSGSLCSHKAIFLWKHSHTSCHPKGWKCENKGKTPQIECFHFWWVSQIVTHSWLVQCRFHTRKEQFAVSDFSFAVLQTL